ncbi:MAG: FtsX-like permease family protein [Burkholderiales bacterium]
MRRGAIALALFAGPLWESKGRFVLSLAAIALGVALGYAVQLVNQSAINEFTQAVQALSGSADLQVVGPRAGFDEREYPRLARLPEVAVASPVVEVDARLAGRRESLRVLGLDVFRAALVQPALVATDAADALDTLRPDAIFLSPAAAERLRAGAGDELRFQSGLGEAAFRVAGILRGAPGRVAFADIAGVQAAFDRLGRLSRVELRVRPGADVAALRARLAAGLPAGVRVERPDAAVERGASLSRSYRVNLNVLALVALFTGGLLVFSTQALAIVRRRAHLALLRTLGVTRRALVAGLLGEALAVGALGAGLGLLVGYALAQAIVRVAGVDLGAGLFRGVEPALGFDGVGAGVFFVLGVAVALAGSLVPALEAGRAAPAAALKAGDEQRPFERLTPVWPGLAVIAAGAAGSALPPVAGLPVFGYVAIGLILIGAIMLMPRAAVAFFGLVRTPPAPALRLAVAQLRGAPGQSMLSLATIVAAVSLLVSMTIMVASFRASLGTWLDQVLPADLYFRTTGAGDSGFLRPADQAAIARVPGVRRVEFIRAQNLLLAGDRPPVTLLARAVDPADPARALPIVGRVIVPAAGAPPPVWVSEPVADVYGFVPGRVVELPLGGRAERFTVAGVWRDYARTQGTVVIERDRYVALTGDRDANDGAVWLAGGADAGAVRDALRSGVSGGEHLDIAAPGEIRARSLRAFDRTFAVTYALELAALVIGLTGLSASFGALVLARRREFGMLRHVGMTRRQIGAMLAAEGMLVGALGLAVGLAAGFVISLVLIHVVNRQSFHWTMELAVPWLPLAAFCATLLAAAALTALFSARAAMADAAARAVKDDW